jgi:hypothetical protein
MTFSLVLKRFGKQPESSWLLSMTADLFKKHFSRMLVAAMGQFNYLGYTFYVLLYLSLIQ